MDGPSGGGDENADGRASGGRPDARAGRPDARPGPPDARGRATERAPWVLLGAIALPALVAWVGVAFYLLHIAGPGDLDPDGPTAATVAWLAVLACGLLAWLAASVQGVRGRSERALRLTLAGAALVAVALVVMLAELAG